MENNYQYIDSDYKYTATTQILSYIKKKVL